MHDVIFVPYLHAHAWEGDRKKVYEVQGQQRSTEKRQRALC